MSTPNKTPAAVEPESDAEVMEFNSVVEHNYFRNALMNVIPEDKRGDKRVDASIKSLYDAYYGTVHATRKLAIEVYTFCELTGLTFEAVGSAMSKGIQKQLSRSYISKLYKAGKVQKTNPVAQKITDIEKLAILADLSSDELNRSLTDQGGIAHLGDKPVSLIKRSDFKNQVAELHPSSTQPVKKPVWNPAVLRKTLENAMSETGAYPELNNVLGQACALLDGIIKDRDERIKAAKATQKEEIDAIRQRTAAMLSA
jgi:hypothetical protein